MLGPDLSLNVERVNIVVSDSLVSNTTVTTVEVKLVVVAAGGGVGSG